jgi:acetolactate synthase-1/2/3 large subunit
VGIKTVTVVNNNNCLGQCLDGINRAYGNRKGKKEELCMFLNIDFAKIAQAMGCLGIRVEDPGEISQVLKKALKSDLPAVIDVATDMNCKAPSPWTPP